MIILARLVQSENAQLLIVVTESGIVTVISFLQSENAESPIVVTEFGIVMLASEWQPIKV